MNTSIKGLLLGSLGCGLWGFSSVCIQFLTRTYAVDEVWLGCMRLFLAGVIFCCVCLVWERRRFLGLLRDGRALAVTLVYAFLGMALMQVVYVFAINTAGAASDSLIAQTSLIYVMFFTCWKERRRPKRHEIICVVLAFTGVFLVATKGDATRLTLGLIPLLYCLSDGMLMACHNLIPLGVFKQYGTLSVNAVALLAGGIMLMPFAQPWSYVPTMGADGWLALATTILMGACCGYAFASQGLKVAGPVLGTFANVVEPVSSLVFSALLLGVTFTFADVLGCAVIGSMMIYLTLGERRAPREVA